MEDQAPTPSAVRFGPFELFVETGELRKDGVRLKLSGQPIQLLARLVAAPGKLVTREELQQELWHGSSYGDFEKGLNAAVNRLREYLGDSATEPKYIETIPRRGYRFIADINSGLSKTPSVEFQQPKPRWKRTTRFVAGLLLAIALVSGLVVASYFGRHPLKAVPTQGRGRVMLAVLPFQNLSNDPEQEYFSDGLTEETITDLGELNPEKLGVIARASAMAYKHTNKTAGQIGQELGVDYILEGSVRREGGRARISTQLIRVVDQTHVWAQSFDREIRDFLEVQRELGEAISEQVQVTLKPAPKPEKVRTRQINPDAYDDYLKGIYLWNQFTPASVTKSIEYFQQAISKDSAFAQAYAGLAESYMSLLDFSVLPPGEAYPRSKAAAHKAVELGPEDSRCHVALGWQLLAYDRDFAGAEREFRRALQLNPSNSEAHEGLAWYLTIRKQFDASLEEVRKAREMDPLSPFMNADVGNMLFYAGKSEEAVQQLRAAISEDPNFAPYHYFLIKIYQSRGLYEDAFQEFLKLQALIGQFSEEELSKVKIIHGKSGWKPALQSVLATMLRNRATGKYVSAYDIAELQLAIGEDEKTIEWLEKAADEHANQVIFLDLDPRFERLHSNPRFQTLLRRVLGL